MLKGQYGADLSDGVAQRLFTLVALLMMFIPKVFIKVATIPKNPLRLVIRLASTGSVYGSPNARW